jgi:hypothetical protein
MTYEQIQTDRGFQFPSSSPNISQKQEQDEGVSRTPYSYSTGIGSYSSQDELNYFTIQSQQAISLGFCSPNMLGFV